MTAVEFLIEKICGEHTDAWKEEIKQAFELEKEQIGYSKEEIIKAAEIGEINMLDAKHIVSLLDEAKQTDYLTKASKLL